MNTKLTWFEKLVFGKLWDIGITQFFMKLYWRPKLWLLRRMNGIKKRAEYNRAQKNAIRVLKKMTAGYEGIADETLRAAIAIDDLTTAIERTTDVKVA